MLPTDTWLPLLPGISLWALALYLPLSLPLGRLEQVLDRQGLAEAQRQGLLVGASVLLALAIGSLTTLLLTASLGPDWAASLGLMAVLGGLLLALGSRRDGET